MAITFLRPLSPSGSLGSLRVVDTLQEMTKRLKGYAQARPVVTFRFATFKMVNTSKGKGIPMKEWVDYLLHLQKGTEATMLPGDMLRWTVTFRG